MAVNKFTGATDANWGTASNWSQGTVPTATDGHVTTFDATSPACTLSSSAKVCNALDFTGYTNTVTMSVNVTVSGAVTLAAGMTIAGSGLLLVNTTATLTSNGKTWPNGMTFQGTGQTYTMADNWTVGNLTVGNGSTTTINGNSITTLGNLTVASSGAVAGTTLIQMTGTGTWSHASTCFLRNDVTINTAGSITFSLLRYEQGTLTITAIGSYSVVGSTLSIGAFTTTVLDTSLITWNNIAFVTNGGTVTLNSNLVAAGNLTVSGSVTATVNSASYTMSVAGNFTPSGGSTLNGTAKIIFNGVTQTWTSSSGSLRMNCDINCTTFVFSGGNCPYGTGTMTWISGVFSSVSSGTLGAVASCTLNLSGQPVPMFSIQLANVTVTLASDLVVSNSIVATGPTSASHSGFVSSSPGTQRVLTVLYGAIIDLGFVNATDIDSSAGQPVYTRKGTLSNATNWRLLVAPSPISIGS